LQWFVVIARNPPDFLQTYVGDGIDPFLDVSSDVTWHAFEILLGPQGSAGPTGSRS
jgi:hypothetical protein